MSDPDNRSIVAAIAPLEAAERRDRELAVQHARREFASWRSLPLMILLASGLYLLQCWPAVRALFWSPPPPAAWRTIEGVLDYSSTPRRSFFIVRSGDRETWLSCAPSLSATSECSQNFHDVLESRLGLHSRFHVVDRKGWLGRDHILTRVEDERGRYVAYPQLRMTLRDLGFSFWLPLVLIVGLFTWQAVARDRAERRAPS